ncbi:hypothetical protein Tco_1518088 [Tanacetum coccineum]
MPATPSPRSVNNTSSWIWCRAQDFQSKDVPNLSQLQWQLSRQNPYKCDPKTCLEVLRTQFKEFFDLKWVTSSDHDSQLGQQRFKDFTGCDPETYRRQLLHELDGLGKCIDERVIQYKERQGDSSSSGNECNSSMEKKDTVTSCSNSEEHIQQLQMQARRQKETCIKWFRAL